MAIISSYPNDATPQKTDKVIGTDASTGRTKNYTAATLSDFVINSHLEKVSWLFVSDVPESGERPLASISFLNYEGNNTAWSGITTLYINTAMPSSVLNSLPYLQRLIGKTIIFRDQNDLSRFGVFMLTALMQVDDTDVYTLSLSFIEGNATLLKDKYYSIQLDNISEGDKNYVHNQSVAASTWNVNHNLSKYASATMVLSTGQKGYGDIKYIDENNLTITFASAESGKAYIN
jgi:hypothetical protein